MAENAGFCWLYGNNVWKELSFSKEDEAAEDGRSSELSRLVACSFAKAMIEGVRDGLMVYGICYREEEREEGMWQVYS